MKADPELVGYIKKRLKGAQEREKIYQEDENERFKRIYHMGEVSAFKELVMILEASEN